MELRTREFKGRRCRLGKSSIGARWGSAMEVSERGTYGRKGQRAMEEVRSPLLEKSGKS